MKLKLILIFMFFNLCINLSAQEVLRVKGKVLSTDHKAIEYATVSFESKKDNFVAEGVTNEKGEFDVEVKAGSYILVIEPLGFEIIQKELDVESTIDLGILTVKTDQTVTLDAAVVKADKPLYKVELDKKVYEMANDPLSQGQTLSDALANVPSVAVDAEGNVSLRGNDNVKFLIDGKPSGMLAGSDIGEALKNIPAENVERIELVTNPSARYEASGSAGIINIILKKGKNLGFNGSAVLNGGIPEMVGANVNLNYKTKKINLFGTLGSRYSDRKGEGEVFTTNYKESTKIIDNYRRTDRESNRIRRNYSIRLGTEYYLDEKNTIGLSAGYNYNNGNNRSLINYNNFNPSMIFISNDTNSQNEREIENNFDIDFNYKHEFDKKGHELSFTTRLSSKKEDAEGNILSNTSSGSKLVEPSNRLTDNFEKNNIAILTADYVRPIGEKGKFELGARVDLNKTKTDNKTFNETNLGLIPDTSFFANVDNQQNIYAAYIQYGNMLGSKFQYFAGLRVESSDMEIKNYTTAKSISKKYTDLFPTLTLNYKLTDKNELQLSYARRVRRPMGFMLLPFFSATDDRNVRNGNPNLNPTYTNSFELSYITSVGKLMLTPSLFYQRTLDNINQFQRKRIVREISEDMNNTAIIYQEQFVNTPINIGNEDRYGVDVTATYHPLKWWNLMFNVNFFGYNRTGYYEEYNLSYNTETGLEEIKLDSQDFSGKGISSRGRLSSNFILPKDFKMQIAGNYMGGMKTAQQKVEDNFSMDLSLSKDLFNKRATLSFNIRDVFDSRKREVTTYAADYTNYENMRWMVRSFNLSFTYRFKKINEKERDRQRPEKGKQIMETEEMTMPAA